MAMFLNGQEIALLINADNESLRETQTLLENLNLAIGPYDGTITDIEYKTLPNGSQEVIYRGIDYRIEMMPNGSQKYILGTTSDYVEYTTLPGGGEETLYSTTDNNFTVEELPNGSQEYILGGNTNGSK